MPRPDFPRAMTLLLPLLTLVFALAAAPAGAATKGPCRADGSGPRCTFWTGKVNFVADGDTFDVDLDGDRSPRKFRVRVTGINAMEQHVYSKYAARRRGECHALEATARLERLIRSAGGRVRLAAQKKSSRSGRRLRRNVAVRVNGRWQDVGATLLAEGHVLWLPSGDEWAWNRQYSALAQQAATSGRNLWDPAACGVGPQQDVPVRLSVNWDADGADGGRNLNGEWIKVRNPSAQPLDLTGWLVRDSFHRQFVFPAGTTVAPGGSLYVHSGRGTATPGHLYWGSTSGLFENVSYDDRGMGDGAYLFDGGGDLRASFIYPCAGACAADPAGGALKLTVQPKRPESITVANHGGAAIDLEGYVLKVHAGARGFSHVLPFDAGTVLAPGEQLTIWASALAVTSRLELSWSKPHYILTDSGNAVDLRNLNDVLIDCFAWGTGRCR
jgi:endonuclease YncB( thermonuclease family)